MVGVSTSRHLVGLARRSGWLLILAEQTGLPPTLLHRTLQWAELVEIRGVGAVTLARLRSVGIETVADLAACQPEALHADLRRVVASPPNLAMIENWILQARRHR